MCRARDLELHGGDGLAGEPVHCLGDDAILDGAAELVVVLDLVLQLLLRHKRWEHTSF